MQRDPGVQSDTFCTWNKLAPWFDSLNQIAEDVPYAWDKQWYFEPNMGLKNFVLDFERDFVAFINHVIQEFICTEPTESLILKQL